MPIGRGNKSHEAGQPGRRAQVSVVFDLIGVLAFAGPADLTLLVLFESGGTDGGGDLFNQTAVAFAARPLGSCTWLWLGNKAFEDNREIGCTYVSSGSTATGQSKL